MCSNSSIHPTPWNAWFYLKFTFWVNFEKYCVKLCHVRRCRTHHGPGAVQGIKGPGCSYREYITFNFICWVTFCFQYSSIYTRFWWVLCPARSFLVRNFVMMSASWNEITLKPYYWGLSRTASFSVERTSRQSILFYCYDHRLLGSSMVSWSSSSIVSMATIE